ncbi:MAG: hypothetical protein WC745_03905 [Patescibacteria group bacterium]|jgi:hypothetical protein
MKGLTRVLLAMVIGVFSFTFLATFNPAEVLAGDSREQNPPPAKVAVKSTSGATVAVGTSAVSGMFGGNVDVPVVDIWRGWETGGAVNRLYFSANVNFQSEFWAGKRARVFVNGRRVGSFPLGMNEGSFGFPVVGSEGKGSGQQYFTEDGSYLIEIRIPISKGYYFSASRVMDIQPFQFYVIKTCRRGSQDMEIAVVLQPFFDTTIRVGDPVSLVIDQIAFVAGSTVEEKTDQWGNRTLQFVFRVTLDYYENLANSCPVAEVTISGKSSQSNFCFWGYGGIQICQPPTGAGGR